MVTDGQGRGEKTKYYIYSRNQYQICKYCGDAKEKEEMHNEIKCNACNKAINKGTWRALDYVEVFYERRSKVV